MPSGRGFGGSCRRRSSRDGDSSGGGHRGADDVDSRRELMAEVMESILAVLDPGNWPSGGNSHGAAV